MSKLAVCLGVLFLLALPSTALADPINLQGNATATFGTGSSGAVVNPIGCVAPCIRATNAVGTSTISYSTVTPEINVTLNPGETSNVTFGFFSATSTAPLPL